MATHVRMVPGEEFRTLFRHHPGAVTVVTARGRGGAPVGFTSTSVISVSAEPPLIAFAVATSSSAWPAIRDADRVSVSFLAADQAGIAVRFAAHGIDRFSEGGWHELASGSIVIDDASSWLVARLVQQVETQSSRLIVAEVEATGSVTGFRARAPLMYHDRKYRGLRSMTAGRGTKAVP